MWSLGLGLVLAAGPVPSAHAERAVSRADRAAHKATAGKAKARVNGKARHKAPAAVAADAPGPAYAGRADARQLAHDIAEKHGLDPAWVEAQIAAARHVPAVARLIMPPPAGTAKNWAAYRARFVEPARVQAGVAFWDAQARWLDAAQTRYGVPPAVVVGIIGVETYYGRLMGSFRVLDALATLSLDFPSGRKDRSGFFREQLGEFLELARREGLDPGAVKGSFAGAIGLGQFMPMSINRFAVDFDGDGHIDMAGNAADVIGSVANFIAAHGWQRELATRFAVKPPVETAERALLLGPDIVPTWTAAQLREHGAELDAAGQSYAGPLALVELQNGDAAPSYIAATGNFYAVTRYNWSAYYALAVLELGETVAARRAAMAAIPTQPTSPANR